MSGREGIPAPLAAALRGDEVLEHIRAHLPECQEGLELLRCDVGDVRYKAGGGCWLLYRLKVRNQGGRPGELLLSGRLLEPGKELLPLPDELVRRYQASSGRLLRTTRLVLSDPPVVLHPYPMDTELPGLLEALDPAAMREHLSWMWANRGVRVRNVRIHTLGYTPEARAALRYEVLAENRRTGVPEVRHLIAKLHAKKPADRLFADAWAVWRARPPVLGLAPPVGYVNRAGVHLQEVVPGERLGGLVSSKRFVKPVRRTARMLAALHGLRVPLSARRDPREEIRSANRWSDALASIRPDLAPRLRGLSRILASGIESRGRITGPLHADFHHTNVLVHEDRVTIIDLDEMAYGDAMVDVGRFLASLRIPALRAFRDPTALEASGEAFLEEYQRHGEDDVRRVRLFEAASLLTAAASAFRIQRPAWRDEVELLLDQAERVAASAGRGASVSVPEEIAKDGLELSSAEKRRWARDGTYIQAALNPHLREEYGADLMECRPRARGKNRRIRYECRGLLGEEPWALTLQGISHQRGGHGLIRRLREVRIALADTPDAPLLPRPIAYFKRISLLVCEVPEGIPLGALATSQDLKAAAREVGAAIRALHRSGIELDGTRTLGWALRRIRRRIVRLGTKRPELASRAEPLLAEVERRTNETRKMLAPTLRVNPWSDLLVGDRIGISQVREIRLAHPLLDAGAILARLALRLGKNGGHQDLEAATAGFREGYAGPGGMTSREGEAWASYEAAALLSLVWDHLSGDPTWPEAEPLLARASHILGS